jgi:hypothetical protein
VRKANETNEEEGRQNAETKTVEPPKPPVCAFGRKSVIICFSKNAALCRDAATARHYTVFGHKKPKKSPLHEWPLGVCWRVNGCGQFARPLLIELFEILFQSWL